jgi:hypothetical protein
MPSSTPHRPDVIDSTGKPWCLRRTAVPYERRRLYRELAPVSRGAVVFARTAVPYERRRLYRELAPRRRLRVGEAPPCPSPHRLPCAGDVIATGHTCRAGSSWARPWAAHAAQAEAEPGQAGLRARCVGRLRRHCATGLREDSAQ